MSFTRPSSSMLCNSQSTAELQCKASAASSEFGHGSQSAGSTISSAPSTLDTDPDNKKHRNFSLANYTIDLNALGHSTSGGRDLFAAVNSSDYDLEIPVHVRDEVGSDDDGPTDFTINLGAWMKGKKMLEKEDAEKAATEEQHSKKASIEDVWDDESAFAPIGVSTPRRVDLLPEMEDVSESTTPPTVQLPVEAKHERVAQEVFDQISTLQAEVERLRREAEEYRVRNVHLEKERMQMESESISRGQELHEVRKNLSQECARNELRSRELSAVHKDAENASKEAGYKISGLQEQLRVTENQLATSRDAVSSRNGHHAEIELLRTELSQCRQALQSEKDTTGTQEQEISSKSQQIQNLHKSMHELRSSNTSLTTEMENAQEQLAETRRMLDTVEDENDRFRHESERQRQEIDSLNTELEEAKQQIEMHRAAAKAPNETELQNQKIEFLQAELADARREAQTQESAAQEATTKAETLQDTIDSLEARLRAQLQSPAASPRLTPSHHTTIYDDTTFQSLSSMNEEASPTNVELADQLDRLSSHYEAQLAAQKSTHDAEMKSLKRALLRAAEGMKKREDRLAAAHAHELATLNRQLDRARHAQPKGAKPGIVPSTAEPVPAPAEPVGPLAPAADNGAAVTSLQKTVASLTARLTATEATLAETQAALQAARATAREQHAAHAAVNAALEARLADACERREAEWRRRVELLLRDRDRMGKVLLWGWGKEEVGWVKGVEERTWEERRAVGGEGGGKAGSRTDGGQEVGKGVRASKAERDVGAGVGVSMKRGEGAMGYRYRFVEPE